MSGAGITGSYISSVDQIADSVQSDLLDWIAISTTTLTGAATAIAITGLDGNTDECYKIDFYVIAGQAAATAAAITFNSDAGNNYYTSANHAAYAAAAANITMPFYSQNDVARNTLNIGTIYLTAKSGYERKAVLKTETGDIFTDYAGRWSNTADNLTTITITGAQANTFGIGTTYKISKRKIPMGVV